MEQANDKPLILRPVDSERYKERNQPGALRNLLRCACGLANYAANFASSQNAAYLISTNVQRPAITG